MNFKIKSISIIAIGALIGGLIGYLYYYFIGCNSGICPITSNPFGSIAYGTVIGILISSYIIK